MNTPVVTCSNISKKFGSGSSEVTPLKGITFTANEGELILLMGPSGSGKTTLISIVGGLLDQTEGQCTVLGQEINQLSEQEKTAFRGKNIGFMFQSFNLVPTLSAVENVAIPLFLTGAKRSDALQEAEKLLASLDLDKQRYTSPQNLSGGEQQRVALARACLHKPKIILCDEPTSFLDQARGKQVMQLLHDYKKESGTTLIIVSHDPRITDFADRILEIDDGILKPEGKVTRKVG